MDIKFEEWYGKNCSKEERSRMFDKNENGYILIQVRMSYDAFVAGFETALNA